MSFDRRKRGRGRDKREGFGDEGFDGYQDFGGKPPERNFGGGYQDRGGGFDRGGPPERKSFGNDSSGGFQNRAPRPGGGGGGMPAQVVGTGTGEVKFFNSQKGFGFIKVDDRPDDVFVHISAVEAAGLTGLAEGQPLSFTLVDRGGRVSATELAIDGEPLPVTDSGGPPREDRGGGRPFEGGGERGPRRQLTGESDTGTVKFFNDVKGFGFIVRDGGGDDAFVHISAVERSGLGTIGEGDRVKFDIEVDRRGKYAAVNLSRAD